MPVAHVLSNMYSAKQYRLRKGRTVRWTPHRSKTAPWCDECFACQHENPTDRTRMRSYATTRRALQGGLNLFLCGPHATLWKERDSADQAS